jgi:hypothetical protein
MVIHPRCKFEDGARLDIEKAINDASEKYELTYGELWRIFSQISAGYAKYIIRQERGEEYADILTKEPKKRKNEKS